MEDHDADKLALRALIKEQIKVREARSRALSAEIQKLKEGGAATGQERCKLQAQRKYLGVQTRALLVAYSILRGRPLWRQEPKYQHGRNLSVSQIDVLRSLCIPGLEKALDPTSDEPWRVLTQHRNKTPYGEAKRLYPELRSLSPGLRRQAVAKLDTQVQKALEGFHADTLFAKENHGEVERHVSPPRADGRTYTLTITKVLDADSKTPCYRHGQVEGLWCEVRRQHTDFPFAWVIAHPNGHDYLLCAERTQGCTVIELDTGRRADFSFQGSEESTAFRWHELHVSPDKLTLAVTGAHWGLPLETVFYSLVKPFPRPGQPDRTDEEFLGWNPDSTASVGTTTEHCTYFNKDVDDMTVGELAFIESHARATGVSEDSFYTRRVTREHTWQRTIRSITVSWRIRF